MSLECGEGRLIPSTVLRGISSGLSIIRFLDLAIDDGATQARLVRSREGFLLT